MPEPFYKLSAYLIKREKCGRIELMPFEFFPTMMDVKGAYTVKELTAAFGKAFKYCRSKGYIVDRQGVGENQVIRSVNEHLNGIYYLEAVSATKKVWFYQSVVGGRIMFQQSFETKTEAGARLLEQVECCKRDGFNQMVEVHTDWFKAQCGDDVYVGLITSQAVRYDFICKVHHGGKVE